MTRTAWARAAVWLAWAACAAPGADLAERIQAITDAPGAAGSAFWGIRIVDLQSGRTVYDLNGGRLFVPASTAKLFTTALALERLGPDYRFETRVVAAGPPDARGTVRGLRLVGAGDPSMSGRALPYRAGAAASNPLAAIEELAGQVAARGVRRIEGGITGDDSAFVREPFPEGWGVEDPVWEYGAAVSALTLHDNAVAVRIRPGERAGDLARVAVSPPVEFFAIDNRVRTTAAGAGRIRVERDPGSRQVRIWGTMPRRGGGYTALLGIDDPARYAALALRDALERRGVTVDGETAARHLYPNQAPPAPERGFELARRMSQPLVEHLRVVNKISQNLHAELMLRAVARARRGTGSREAGLAEMEAFLAEAGIAKDAYSLADGSGLSRLDLASPAALAGLLSRMWALPSRDQWTSLLPVAGEDGTLAHRFRGGAAAGRIRAKTGSMAHVTALAGYAERPDGGQLAFAIMVNNHNGGAGEIRGAIDRICSLMLE